VGVVGSRWRERARLGGDRRLPVSSLWRFNESAVHVREHGVTAEAILATTKPVFDVMWDLIAELAAAAAARDHSTDQATLAVSAAAVA
jgi:hypothetical protein